MKHETKFKIAALSYDTLANCKFSREGKSKYHIFDDQLQLHIIVELENNVYTLKCLHQNCVVINETISDFTVPLEYSIFALIDYHLTILNEVKSKLNATRYIQVVETQVHGLDTFTFNCGEATVKVKPLSQGYELIFDNQNLVVTEQVGVELSGLDEHINNYDEHIHLGYCVEYVLKNSENLQPLEQPKVNGLKKFSIQIKKGLLSISEYDLEDSEETTFKHGYKIMINNNIVAKKLTINDIVTDLSLLDGDLLITTTNRIEDVVVEDTYKSEPENIYSDELELLDEFVKDFHELLKTN